MNLLEMIPTGEDNAISRTRLAISLGMTDRDVRREIARLRNEGHPICSTSHKRGYFMATDSETLERFIREYTSYCRAIYRTVDKMRANFKEA